MHAFSEEKNYEDDLKKENDALSGVGSSLQTIFKIKIFSLWAYST